MFPLSRILPHAVPFLTAADRTATGFIRVINRSNRAGTVQIVATDDTGARYGPVTFEIGANQARHFTADDLETGEARGGISGSLGDGTGDWWLTLTTDLEIVPLAYVRTQDGLLAPMLATVAADGHNRYPVLFVNPCRNRTKVSMLRIVNPGGLPARIKVSGVDDAGVPSAETVLELPERGAAMYRSCELEEAIGVGSGKWRLTVEADHPLWIMSLVSTPAGHLLNLSDQTPMPYFPTEDQSP